MIRRICPICDQVMKTAHYCGNCKRLVRHPYVRNRGYYLNERHPQDERGCSFHNADTHKVTEEQYKDGRQAENQKHVRLDDIDNSNPRFGNLAIVGILFVAVFISIVPVISRQRFHSVHRVIESSVEFDADLWDYIGDANESEYQELGKADVTEAGVSCNTRGHFAVQGACMEQPILDILQNAGYHVIYQNTSSYNEISDDGVTWYTTWITIELEGETEDSYQYVEVDFDTGTGELHEISLALDDQAQLTAVTCAILKALAEKGELPADSDCFALVAEELPGALESRSEYKRLEGAVLIEGISYKESYSVYISRNIDSDL